MIQEITGAAFAQMIINAAAALEIQKQQINELNVFPVPDGDTGTNMCLTVGAGANELRNCAPRSLGCMVEIAANALLRGARGNSGVIISLLFRGIAKTLKGYETADTKLFAEAMTNGVSAAYKAVMKPTEGTILTVSRLASAAGVEFAENESDVELFFEYIIEVANVALADTVNQNPVLKKAGVIDAGGKGYICILEGMLKALRGEMIDISNFVETTTNEKADFSAFGAEDITFTYCTEFIVARENLKSPEVLRDYLGSIGDSLVLVDDDEIIKVHVHTNDPGDVLTQALAYGSLITVKVENMREQHTEKVINEQEAVMHKGRRPAAPEKKYGVVAVSAGEGMASLFTDLGVDGIITGGQTMNPSTEDILKEIDRTPAEIVYVLPNNKNIIMAAQQCIPLSEKKVIVIPSKTIPQGITALLSFDTTLSEDECTAELEAAISRVHTIQVTYAARDSVFDGHDIHSGEFLALLENTLIANDADLNVILDKIAETLAPFDSELVTIYYGEDVDESDANTSLSRLSSSLPDVEISLVFGGQPVYYYMISAE